MGERSALEHYSVERMRVRRSQCRMRLEEEEKNFLELDHQSIIRQIRVRTLQCRKDESEKITVQNEIRRRRKKTFRIRPPEYN